MFHNLEMMLGLYSTHFWLAKVRVPTPPTTPTPINPPPVTTLPFPVPQFFVALLAGVVIAFAFQFLLTNFTLAAGISAGANPLEAEAEETWGSKFQEVESKVGFWALITVNIALFIACFLAIKLTFINNISFAAITSIVIWSIFFLLLLWLSSKAIGSVVSSVVDTASSGMQGIGAIATTALSANAVNARVVNTVEESIGAVRRELTSAIDPTIVKDTVQDYLGNLKPSQLNLSEIRENFQDLLKNSDLQSISPDNLKNIDRQTFVNLVSSRTDFSKQDLNQIADQLEKVWQEVIGEQQQNSLLPELLNFLQKASPNELKSEQLNQKLNQLLEETNNQSTFTTQAMQLGLAKLIDTVLQRVDLSDVDGQKIIEQLQQLKDQGTEQVKQLTSSSSNPIRGDVEEYLLNSQPWHLNRETIKQEFKEVIYDPEAAPSLVRSQLEQLNRDDLVNILNQRDEFSSEQINELVDSLESIRQEVLSQVANAESEEKSQDLHSRVENYLRSTSKEELNPEAIERNFKTLLEDTDAGVEELSNRLSQFDHDSLKQLLSQTREDLNEEEIDQILNQLLSTRDRVNSEAQEMQEKAQFQAQELGQKVESYLRDTKKEELNPEGIKEDLKTLRDKPQAGIKALRERLSQFDRDTVVKLLSERGDLNEEEINQFIDRFEEIRDNLLHAPQMLAGKAQEQYEDVTSKIADYFRATNLEELDPDSIKQDLQQLFDDPQQGTKALRERFSHLDRETLTKLLSQREDLSEEQVNQYIDRVQAAIQGIVKTPRRLASRTQKQIQDWQSSFENYLRSTNKEELNPEGIKRDLQTLLKEPGTGLSQISDRLSEIDRDTVVALLSQREDISEAEANEIVERIDSVRHQLLEQFQAIQQQAQSAIEGTFDKIRNYLNSLERPELNYDGIKQDLEKLFSDPEAGVDALRDRASQFDRDTIVALLSSREDISEQDVNRIIDQVESVRDRFLNRLERIQQKTQARIDEIKHNAREQVIQARKATATAAWWLFGTALTSAGVAVLAGVMAIRGLAIFS
ncbi:hypothetical protein Sta7437_3661 [Stanieria cyanosphaera PCC 7437]|uniref:Uncharacterized protein n=1 Tax=Stanieria cyanosphaera (strain ATCC 29371 / PCC 7437) TaxID=111780 RepID=K9XYQ4_STAC7|nr:hypothetical protein [Stanieria cyanosphaera]AFZ37159.1 hypothetical protein Sta7437_3661 [Stanieria cyanosphaera PCC 7437]